MRLLNTLRDAAVFAPCYVALDWASYIDPVGPFNITPWNPQPALAIVWMVLGGLGHLPVVAATIFAADLVVRHAPGGYALNLATSAALALGYAGLAWALRAALRDAALGTAREVAMFCAIVIAGTFVVGATFVGLLDAAGQLGSTPMPTALVRFWVGDAVGVLVTAPLLLFAADTTRRNALLSLARRPEAIAQVAVLVATLVAIFAALDGDPARRFYLLFLPLIWISARHGLGGAIVAMAIVQVGVVLGIRDVPASLPAVELQALVAALSLTALFLGVMVDERRRAEDGLRQTIRLAAAGEMAGAIAHEVNQPLTALLNYGRSAQMLAEKGADPAQTAAVVARMLSEGERAGAIVRRLRDFFRNGSLLLEPVAVERLLSGAQSAAAREAEGAGIALTMDAGAGLPSLLVDRLQIDLVLRNLVTNAIESIVSSGAAVRRIELRAERSGDSEVVISVSDSGPGVAGGIAARLFQPFASGKRSGMGLGLAVSRAIAEAHGGSLVATPGPAGDFRLILPCERET